MVTIESMIYGIYPRSDDLRLSVSKWERKSLSMEDLENKVYSEKKSLLSSYRNAGLNYYTDPLLNWQDILRIVASMTIGPDMERLARYKETNTFYRQPEIVEYPTLKDLDRNGARPDTFLPGNTYVSDETEAYCHFLPGIESFVNMSFVSPDLDRDKVKISLLDAYKEIMKRYKMERLVVFEPYPDSNIFNGYSEIFGGAQVFYIRSSLGKDPFLSMEREPYSIISHTEEDYMIAAKHCALPGISLVDAQNTRLEDVSSLRAKALNLAGSVSRDRILVTHTEYLDFLPRSIADSKVKMLGGVTSE